MKSGYNIYWTDNALIELSETFKYLENEFTDQELQKSSNEIEQVTHLISKDPFLFALSKFKGVRRVVVRKHNVMY